MSEVIMHDERKELELDDKDSPSPGDTPKKAGRRKINIEFIEDKSRRHITFSKRKAGIMKKAYELSTLTGTQVLLLVASETGHVYTFATPKLQPLITKPEGKNLIQSCLNAPDTSAQPPPPQPAPQQRMTHNSSAYPEPMMGYPQPGSEPVPPPPHTYEEDKKDTKDYAALSMDPQNYGNYGQNPMMGGPGAPGSGGPSAAMRNPPGVYNPSNAPRGPPYSGMPAPNGGAYPSYHQSPQGNYPPPPQQQQPNGSYPPGYPGWSGSSSNPAPGQQKMMPHSGNTQLGPR
eukprot:TRINITY_DN1007_c1_g1_i1.p1 TRINITY_DN1007_c1_g1~~TRINITY_DN1007_c1_g1_i1.p1  ORF type:complete len:288 (-),score=109.80 TRINITY_DN1007_c1_g1_i1:260-1123(-)